MPRHRAVAAVAPPEASSRVSAREKAVILKAVADKHGSLAAALVVRESDPANPGGVARSLAGVVGWGKPDAEAATLWREDQARAVIRSVTPELIQLGVFEVKAPFYVHDPAAGAKAGYVPLASLKSGKEMAEDALQSEVERAVSALERAYSIALALEQETEGAAIFGALAALGRAPAIPAEVGESASASV